MHQKGIGEGMANHIRIRVAQKADRARKRHPPKNQGPAFHQTVDIIAQSDFKQGAATSLYYRGQPQATARELTTLGGRPVQFSLAANLGCLYNHCLSLNACEQTRVFTRVAMVQ